MKILLLGEYSRLHNSLKEGLVHLGNEVTIVGTGDNFKKYDVDFSIHPVFFLDLSFPKKFKNLIWKAFKFDLEKTEKGIRFYFLLKKLKNFDHIQLINSDAIETHPRFGVYLLQKLFQNNKTASKSLLVCGDETPVIDFQLTKALKYSILTPYLLDNSLKNKFHYSLKYATKSYRRQFQYVLKIVQSLIVSDFDYKIPMEKMGFDITFIPNPINIEKIDFKKNEIDDTIVIFLGINSMSSIKKGIAFFEEALVIIKKKFPNKVKIIVSEDLPYSDYISSYNQAHIVLDQVYSFDQGYNALEAMAKGKVVFTGAEAAFYEHYKLKERVAVNALPDIDFLVNELSFLIENLSEIVAIGSRAREFIEKEHNYIHVAQKYIDTWTKNS